MTWRVHFGDKVLIWARGRGAAGAIGCGCATRIQRYKEPRAYQSSTFTRPALCVNYALPVFGRSQRYARMQFLRIQRPNCEYSYPIGLLTILATCTLVVHAVKINECGTRLKEAQDTAWNATHSSIPPPPLQLSYEQCLVECGEGLGDISWSVFAQSVTTWFIPWIALSFQIPFGAEGEPLFPLGSRPSRY